jgi:hypothetical protein
LTSTRPTAWQRAASALSFGFFRAGSKGHANRVPSPALDLAAPYRSVYSNLFSDSLQALEFDSLGAAIRSTTRTYRGNSSDYSKLQVFQALATLDNVERDPANTSVLSDPEFHEIYSRLSLSLRTFGGLVRERQLGKYFDKQTSQLQQTRGHNWDLLRQRAELNGLIFEPLALASGTPSEALLWISRSDLPPAKAGGSSTTPRTSTTPLTSRDREEADPPPATPAEHHFDGQFLGISDPWSDDRLTHWTGYTQFRYFDSSHHPVPPGTSGALTEELIPLALYNLDYPRAPLLLADFRNSLNPKRRELVSQGVTSITAGVLGLTRFGNPEFFAADAAWTFIRRRHGAAMNRNARLQAYSEAREFLAVDSQLDPALKIELQRHLDHLALNPRENGVLQEASLAREQYAALLRFAGSSRGAAKLERDRRKELEAYQHPWSERFIAGFGRIFSRRPPIDIEKPDPVLRAQLDAFRRTDYHVRFLEQVLASGPSPDVVWDPAVIAHSVSALASEELAQNAAWRGPVANGSCGARGALCASDELAALKAQLLVSQVCARALDAELRLACLGPMRAPLASALPLSQPIASRPLASETFRSEPLGSPIFEVQPLAFQPLTFQSLASQALASQQ